MKTDCRRFQSGLRPGLVFQNNLGNAFSPNLIALSLTSSIKKSELPAHVTILSDGIGLKRGSMVLCELKSILPPCQKNR